VTVVYVLGPGKEAIYLVTGTLHIPYLTLCTYAYCNVVFVM